MLPPPTLEEQQAEAAARQAEADAEGMWRPSLTAKAKPRNAGARSGSAAKPLSCLVLRLGWLGFMQDGAWLCQGGLLLVCVSPRKVPPLTAASTGPWDPDEPSWGLSEPDCAQVRQRCARRTRTEN